MERRVVRIVAATLAALVLASLTTACMDDATGPGTPDGWIEHEDCGSETTWAMPPDAVELRNGIAIDSCVAIYDSPTQETWVETGHFASPRTVRSPPHVDVVEWLETVDGREARFRSSFDSTAGADRPFHTSVWIPFVRPGFMGAWEQAAVTADGMSLQDRDDALITMRGMEFVD